MKRGDPKGGFILEVRKQLLIPREGMDETPCQMQCGRLPACAPLAIPYVPRQGDNPPVYEAKMGVVRGTLFPGLDLPFMDFVNEKPLPQTSLQELQTMSFAIAELGEYLDTHQEDAEAFALFRSYCELYRKGRAGYEEANGPLTQESAADFSSYRWMHDPWPWDVPDAPAGEG